VNGPVTAQDMTFAIDRVLRQNGPGLERIVREVVAASLGLSEEEVVSSALLTENLGATSIEWLDIVFRLEVACDVRLSLIKFVDTVCGYRATDHDSSPDSALMRVTTVFPEMTWDDSSQMSPAAIIERMTIRDLVRAVAWHIAQVAPTAF